MAELLLKQLDKKLTYPTHDVLLIEALGNLDTT